MNAKDIYTKTLPFVWAKLLLGLATVLISAVLFAILMGIGWLFGENGIILMFLLWLGATGFVRFAIMHYMGYLVKAGHIAVIAATFRSGRVPDNQVAVGKAMVLKRFATSNVYFALDKLVAAAVKQLQNALQKVGNALDFIPGMGAVTGLAQFFVSISLGYIDECCLGWTFYQKDQGAFKSAADGVAIYAQNWKPVLGNAAKTMVSVLMLMLATLLAAFLPVGLIFKLLNWSPLAAFLLACLIAWAVKFAFIDSWIMIKMMTAYMEVAPSTQITFDLYGKLCTLSGKFKELFQRGRQETASSAADAAPVRPRPARTDAQPASATVLCANCNARNQAGTKFCGKCGVRLE